MEDEMDKVSILIPTRNERFLAQTVNDVFNKARGEIEVVVYLDGYKPDPPLKERPGLVQLFGPAVGMRGGINAAAAAATGEFLCKSDGHNMFAEGFDEVLKKDCEDDWVVVPRRKSLDAEKWDILQNGKSPVDYHFLSYPLAKPEEIGMHGTVWKDRARARMDTMIDDEMSSQGSCWFMKKTYFDRFNGLPHEGYGDFVQEFQQIGNRTWLSGGRVVINKNTWYAHLHKGKTYGRGYSISQRAMIRGGLWSADYWLNNRWPDRKYDLEWLIDKFSPVPTWPTGWEKMSREIPGVVH
jgi:glycosyltransferase involved in cell wall biosynthesis